MLGSNRKADSVLCNSLVSKFCVIKLTVGCAGWMNNQRLYICNICKKAENLQVINKFPGFFAATFDVESENACAAVREVFLVKFMVRMVCQ